MPEAPEIIITAQYLLSKIKNNKLTNIDVISGRYTHQELLGYENLSYPYKIKNIFTKGKFLWIELSKNTYIFITFGMTGSFSFTPSKNTRIQFTINNKKLNYIDPRNFGTIEFTTDKNKLLQKLNKLAPDVLQTIITDDEIADRIIKFNQTRKNKNLVKVLMDQSLIVSGIGNYLCAEILYDAKLNPHRDTRSLTPKEILILARSIRKITKYAYFDNTTDYIDYKGNLIDFHPDILVKPFSLQVYQQQYDKYNNKIVRDEIIKGRIIHWVPEIQV